ncbi:MAG: exodeoxyribonuclease VII large subunit [Desulfuromonadaceae bacterium]|nr:exodeoxyribonuclease VII large subunit [Desulfuromonadaceae bacterium]MDD2854315.1 exodeoxyribonuclease VII large subunit [Desulfuromonadaceae bacterium]
MDIFSEKTILTVSRLTALLRGVLEENFEHLWVQGEVSNLSYPSSGHCYFTIKDSDAQLRCVMFKSTAKRSRFRLTDGMAIIVRGRISVYDQRGEYQLICEYVEPSGTGALQTAFLQLKEKLAGEGLFNKSHKICMPRFPNRIGVITSPTGAAIHDILNVLNRRFASINVLIYPVRVQGEGAAVEIARAIDEMNRLTDIDLLIVGRGGGSIEDLWAFNEEAVARAVFRSKLPIISAVGHETDWTISDFVADLRAPTPSAAAELVISSSSELKNHVDAQMQHLRRSLGAVLERHKNRLEGMRRALHDPRTMLGHLAQRMDDLSSRLATTMSTTVLTQRSSLRHLQETLQHNGPKMRINTDRQQIVLLSVKIEAFMKQHLELLGHTVGEAAAKIDVLSPLKTLARGYSIATAVKSGKVVSDSKEISIGDQLLLKLHRGAAECRVESLESGKT